MKISPLILAVGIGIAAPVSATNGEDAVRQMVAQPEIPIVITGERPEAAKPVCRQVEELGSIIPRRVCRKKADWASIARQNERRTRDYVNDKNLMSGRIDPNDK